MHVGYLQLVTAFYKSGLNHNLFICIVFTLPKKDFLKPHNKNKFLNFELPLWSLSGGYTLSVFFLLVFFFRNEHYKCIFQLVLKMSGHFYSVDVEFLMAISPLTLTFFLAIFLYHEYMQYKILLAVHTKKTS